MLTRSPIFCMKPRSLLSLYAASKSLKRVLMVTLLTRAASKRMLEHGKISFSRRHRIAVAIAKGSAEYGTALHRSNFNPPHDAAAATKKYLELAPMGIYSDLHGRFCRRPVPETE